jgi:hypothetical protein
MIPKHHFGHGPIRVDASETDVTEAKHQGD